MKTYKYITLLVLLINCALYSVLAAAETRYVSDQLETTLRRGPTNGHAVLRMLKSGTALEVLENDAESGHTRVKTQSGVEGWVLSRYLSTEPTARTQLEKMIKEFNHVDNADSPASAQLKIIKSEYENAHRRVAQLENENKQLGEQLASIKHTAANVLSIDKENKKFRQKLAASEEHLNSLQIENSELHSSKNKDWFFAGAIVLGIGLLLGLIFPRLVQRKTSRYGSF